jgi:hypothetical protein
VFGASNLLRRTANASRDKSPFGRAPLPANLPACYPPSRSRTNFKRKPSDKAVTPGPTEEEIHEALR